MKENFFKPEDDFNAIIEKKLLPRKVKTISQVSTGWTNIVFEAITEENISYFFRFPRDDFWSRMMLKDCAFCDFIYGKTSFKTPNLELSFDKDRPFSVHEKINGIVLTEKLKDLTAANMKKIADDITKFISEIKSLDQSGLPDICKVSLLSFLDELANLHFSDLNLWQYDYFKSEHTDNYLVHGDLNPGNMIIDDDYNLVAVIDFCFAGLGNPYADVSRVIGRSPSEFKKIMIDSYEKHTGKDLNMNTLEQFIKVWTDIEIGYIDYIRNNNPDIKLPDSV